MNPAKQYKFIEMHGGDPMPGRKTRIYEVCNKQSGAWLGSIRWYGSWRQYCFMPAADTVFSSGCMADIIDFISELRSGS